MTTVNRSIIVNTGQRFPFIKNIKIQSHKCSILHILIIYYFVFFMIDFFNKGNKFFGIITKKSI